MRRLLILSMLLGGGCTTLAPAPALYGNYYEYRVEASDGNLGDTALRFFSPGLLEDADLNDPETVDQLLFNKLMVETFSHHEKTDGTHGCLTINGEGHDKSPLIFNIEYVLLDSAWLMNEIDVLFVDGRSGFLDRARCPGEYIGKHAERRGQEGVAQ